MSSAPTTFEEATAILAERLPGYEARPQQVRLARAIERSWDEGEALVGQAGCGTGKSLAALVPAILSRERTVYSTATKALQSQLVTKDLPFLAANLDTNFRFAMLQGRSNYFCHLRASENAATQPVIAANFVAFTDDDEWATEDVNRDFNFDGLRDTLPQPVDNASWSKMTISAEECPRKKCPYWDVCRFERARAKALAADVVVANHALVALDGVIFDRTEGNADILGPYHHLIVDEVHEFEEYVTNALTATQTMGTYQALAQEAGAVFRFIGSDDDTKVIEEASMELLVHAQQFFDTFPVGRVRHGAAIAQADLIESLINVTRTMATTLDECRSEFSTADRTIKARITRLRNRLGNLQEALRAFLLKRDTEIVRQFEVVQRGQRSVKTLQIIPVSVASWCEANLWSRVTPTMMSATVLVDGSAEFVADQLGIDRSAMAVVDVGTPFDFLHQSRLYVPAHITEPTPAKRAQWEAEMMPLLTELVEISRGRALLLFTSIRQMESAYNELSRTLPYPCRKQGDGSSAFLTDWFRNETHSVLFATKTFFQGIDIQGESLSLVVIDKLPFPSPNDPLIEARSEDIERRGGSSFADLSVPMMSLDLQQACGRLIRTKTDTGVMAIMDPRLFTKGYGAKIRRSLPAPVVTDLTDVENFFGAL